MHKSPVVHISSFFSLSASPSLSLFMAIPKERIGRNSVSSGRPEIYIAAADLKVRAVRIVASLDCISEKVTS